MKWDKGQVLQENVYYKNCSVHFNSLDKHLPYTKYRLVLCIVLSEVSARSAFCKFPSPAAPSHAQWKGERQILIDNLLQLILDLISLGL